MTQTNQGPYVRRRRYGDPREIPRWEVYNKLPSICVDWQATPPTDLRRKSDVLFERVQETSVFGPYKVEEKRIDLQHQLHALKQAMYLGGCVINHRNAHHPECTKARLQVIDALTELNLVHEVRSLPGSPKASRLLAMPELQDFVRPIDRWPTDPSTFTQFVFLTVRKTRQELSFDPMDNVW